MDIDEKLNEVLDLVARLARVTYAESVTTQRLPEMENALLDIEDTANALKQIEPKPKTRTR